MKKIDLRSEKGAALVLEATIVYPITLVVVFFMFIWGLTYIQKAYLNHCSYQMATYVSKCILYPGYQHLEEPFYESSDDTKQMDRVNAAMDVHNPYRYFNPVDTGIKEIIDNSADVMVNQYLPTKGYLKAVSGTVPLPDGFSAMTHTEGDGYTCGVRATTNTVTVFLGQRYVFSDLFRMIGMGGRNYNITAFNSAFVSDSVELVRITDMVGEMVAKLDAEVLDGKLNDVLNKFGVGQTTKSSRSE